tara:strand:+ start:540 stop:920 length:381 start_codon:yes stop_codon:yes gene_type:complete
MKNNLSYDVYYKRFAKVGCNPKGDEYGWTFLSAYKSVILDSLTSVPEDVSHDVTDIGYLRARSRVLEEIMRGNYFHDSGWEFQYKIVKSIDFFTACSEKDVVLRDNKIDKLSDEDIEWQELMYIKS